VANCQIRLVSYISASVPWLGEGLSAAGTGDYSTLRQGGDGGAHLTGFVEAGPGGREGL